jgi:hypothetical protein
MTLMYACGSLSRDERWQVRLDDPANQPNNIGSEPGYSKSAAFRDPWRRALRRPAAFQRRLSPIAVVRITG